MEEVNLEFKGLKPSNPTRSGGSGTQAPAPFLLDIWKTTFKYNADQKVVNLNAYTVSTSWNLAAFMASSVPEQYTDNDKVMEAAEIHFENSLESWESMPEQDEGSLPWKYKNPTFRSHNFLRRGGTARSFKLGSRGGLLFPPHNLSGSFRALI